ncbi:MAG: hypothetical protein WH035_06660 [Spirochaetota bacterium]
MLEFERDKFDNFINLGFDEILESFEQNPDITDDKNYWFFDNEKQDVLFISYADPSKFSKCTLIHKEDELFVEQNKISIALKASIYAGYIMYEQGFPLLILNANLKTNGNKNISSYDSKQSLDTFIDDNPDFDLEETKLIIFLFNEGRDYYSTTVQLPSKYRGIMKELKLKENLLDIPDLDYLSEQYRIPSINLAIGFYDFGKASERVNYLDLEDSIRIAFSITELLEPVDKENLPIELNEEYEEEDEYEEEEENYEDLEEDDDDYDEEEDEDEDYEDEDYEEDDDDY